MKVYLAIILNSLNLHYTISQNFTHAQPKKIDFKKNLGEAVSTQSELLCEAPYELVEKMLRL